MPDPGRRRVSVVLPWSTLFKIMAAVALVWVWLTLYQLVLLVVVAVLLAVTLDPVVRRLQRLGLPRWGAATLVCFAMLAAIGGFIYLAGSSLIEEARTVGENLGDVERGVTDRLPPLLRDAFGIKGGTDAIPSYVAQYAVRFVRAVTSAAFVFALAFILTLYLLIEGDRTYQWLIAFVPNDRRGKVQATAAESQQVIFGYVAGNIATSIFATVFVIVALSLLHVPAALLLGVLAGVCDFVPVLGFIVSSVPAVVLALTVSSGTAVTTLLCYVAYHVLENYLIAPRVYGDRLKLSNVAVVLAFAVGAALAGVVGALIALPIAAAYPAIERIWLRDKVGETTVQEHKAIARKAG
jgi:predicted PurR-regulated permease PerM